MAALRSKRLNTTEFETSIDQVLSQHKSYFEKWFDAQISAQKELIKKEDNQNSLAPKQLGTQN